MKLEQLPKLAQQQTLSPKIMLSMKMLPLTNIELELQISRELEENPALEILDREPKLQRLEEREDNMQLKLHLFQPFQETNHTGRSSNDEQFDFMASVPTKSQGLSEHLFNQLKLLDLSPEVKSSTEEIIGNLDWKGFLTGSREEIMESFPEELKPYFEEGLHVVQSLDPAGIGAEDLRECLLLQFRNLDSDTSIAETIIRDHFDLLIKNHIPQIANKLNCTVEKIKDELLKIERFSFHPGAAYRDDVNETIHPDIIMEEATNGYRLKIINEGVPHLTISKEFQELLAKKDLDRKTKEYLKKKLESAKWIIQAIDGRRRTLKNITGAILEFQQGFVRAGKEQIRPLKMQTIADSVGVHISTISRTIKSKHIQTPWGIIPLRSFFGGGILSSEGKLTAIHKLKDNISEIVNRENKKKPLTDNEIVSKLKAQGFKISRRTVSKYRSSINIPPANLRRAY